MRVELDLDRVPIEGEVAPSRRKRTGSMFARIFLGGRADDASRSPRYAILFLLGLLGIWAPICFYLEHAPVTFTSEVSMILPGAGASASVNLSDIGQASSTATSPYTNNTVSPTVTYKRLLGARRVLKAAADAVGEDLRELGKPRVKLVDQTGLVFFEMKGATPEIAQTRAETLTAAFFNELDRLRSDEQARRKHGGEAAIREYRDAVDRTRRKITWLQNDTGLITMEQYRGLVSDTEAMARRLGDVETSLLHAEAVVASLSKTLESNPAHAALALALHGDPEFRALAQAMSASAAELGIARGTYGGENHPAVVSARTAYRGAKSRLEQRVETVVGSKEPTALAEIELIQDGERAAILAELVRRAAERDGLAAERRGLVRALTEAQTRVMSLVDTAARLDDLNRDYQVAEAVFASAMARTNTTTSDVYASYPLIQVLEEASLPEEPSSPDTLIALAAGALGSVCLFVGLILAWLRRPLIGLLTGARSQIAAERLRP